MWGGKDCQKGDDDGGSGSNSGDGEGEDTASVDLPYLPPRYITVLKDGCDYIDGDIKSGSAEGTSSVANKIPQLQLTQYRVAWFEQIVLRMNYIPHTVENSGYAAIESTGGLPYLLDLSSRTVEEEGGNTKNIEEDGKDDREELRSARKESLSNLNKPVLIGRNQPGGLGSYFFQCQENNKSSSSTLPSGSHIIDYLRLKHSHGMKRNLLFQEHLGDIISADAMAYETLIQDKLNYILLALRYANDPAWEEVYRQQGICATLDPHGTYAAAGSKPKSFFNLWAWYQTYAERSLALHNILPSAHAHGGLGLELFRYNDHRHSGNNSKKSDSDEEDSEEEEVHQHHLFSSFFTSHGGGGGGDTGNVNVGRAMEIADIYYASLEERLGKSNKIENKSEQATFFLGTAKPTYLDAVLFANLAEAICDVHLVLVLAKHSKLVQYFSWMYEKYFGEGYAAEWKSNSSGNESVLGTWIQENNVVNALNAFNQIPEATDSKSMAKSASSFDDEGHARVHAIRLMQQMAVHCKELDEALRDAAALRIVEGGERAVLEGYHRPIGQRLYRWIMGSKISFWGSGQSTSESADKDGEASGEEPSTEENNKQRMHREHMKRMKRDRRTNDELWLSGVVVAIVTALVVSASGRSKR